MSDGLRRLGVLGTTIGALGVVLCMTPAMLGLEESIGLGALFKLRGTMAAPDGVVIVSIQDDSGTTTSFAARKADHLPRAVYAQLVRRLSEAGARVVAFDIMFDEPAAGNGDRLFEDAIFDSGNVILLERVVSKTVEIHTGKTDGRAIVDQRVPPIAALRNAAVASAPFTLPIVPIRVGQFWAFGRGGGGTGSLPVATLQAYALPAMPEFIDILRKVRPGLAAKWSNVQYKMTPGAHLERTVRRLRNLFRSNPELAAAFESALGSRAMPSEHRHLLRSLVAVYDGSASRYLSYYGPPHTVRTIPYAEVAYQLSANSMKQIFDGKAVFIGFSDTRHVHPQDWFYSVFSQPSGQNLSGVEIGATAFANLLEGGRVTPMSVPACAFSVFIWGIAVAMIATGLSGATALIGTLVLVALYIGAALLAFTGFGLWWPLVVPLLIQTPAALIAGLLWNQRMVKRQHERIGAALGYYLPARAVDRIAHAARGTRPRKELIDGTCLVTDAEQFTAVSESMSPSELGQLMDDYYRVLLDTVTERGATVADMAGDSMVAVWVATQAGNAHAAQAIAAADAVRQAVETFNAGRSQQALPTRIGLDSGQMVLGSIGSGVRGEYRAIGDIVNTAARLQGLNRQLGTRILLTEATAMRLPGTSLRSVGKFVLVGKTLPIGVFELPTVTADPASNERFADALRLFQEGRWDEAGRAFAALHGNRPWDGPAHFYEDECELFRNQPPTEWHGVLRMTTK